ncbi:MAG: outer membrane lipoprotein carrier protein LolA [Bacteroidales bacterium]|nr:outer membrane lipoprotein carrier protein LolA [Bacteroidales bacterium]
MKRWLLILTGLAFALAASAQENILDRLKAANTYETLQASFTQTRHSSMLTKDLVSEGRMVLASPDRIRWEVLKPYPSVFVSRGELAIAGRRFRIPTEKDFTATVLEGEDLTVKLVPVRRDLKSLFREIIVHADKQSLQLRSALLMSPDGDWTQLEFKDLVVDRPVDAKLFEKE